LISVQVLFLPDQEISHSYLIYQFIKCQTGAIVLGKLKKSRKNRWTAPASYTLVPIWLVNWKKC